MTNSLNQIRFNGYYNPYNLRFGNNTPTSGQTVVHWGTPNVTNPQQVHQVQQQPQSGIKTSTILKWGAVLGGIAAGAFLIAAAIKRGRYAPLKNLPEHINFTKATSYEDAIKFGQETFGIKSYQGFGAKDLDVLNWFNEGLTNVSNAMKGKNVRVPKNVVYSTELGKETIAAVIPDGIFAGRFEINKNLFRNIDNYVEDCIKDVDFLKKPAKNDFIAKLKLIGCHQNISSELRRRVYYPETVLLEILNNPELMEKAKKVGINIDVKAFNKLPDEKAKYNFVSKLKDKLGYNPQVDLNPNPYRNIYHEMGHLQDIVPRCPTTVDFNFKSSEYPKALKEWVNNKINQRIAINVSDYSTCGPGEFIAETFAGLVSGKKYPQEVLDLYKKLQGPMLPSMAA